MRAPDHIMRDLARKAGDEAAATVKRLAFLLDDPSDKLMLAISSAGSAIGAAAGYSELIESDVTPEDRVDFMWALLRPIALAALGGSTADFEKLLSGCRTSPREVPE